MVPGNENKLAYWIGEITYWIEMRLCRLSWYRVRWVDHYYSKDRIPDDDEWNTMLLANLIEQARTRQ